MRNDWIDGLGMVFSSAGARRVIDVTPRSWTQRLQHAAVSALALLVAVALALTTGLLALALLALGLLGVAWLKLAFWWLRQRRRHSAGGWKRAATQR